MELLKVSVLEKSMNNLWLATVFFACGEKSSDTSVSSEEPSDTGETSVSLVDNPCDESTESLEVLYSGWGGFDEPIGTGGLTITTQEDWDAFVSGFSFGRDTNRFSRDTFDWSMEQVLVGSIFQSSTCGLSMLVSAACSVDGKAIVHMQVEDSSGGCDAVCDAEGQMVHVVVAPSSATPEYSLHMTDGCQ